MKTKLRKEWPVLTHYDADHLVRIALPLGGIGTGTVSLGGRGDLRDWEIVNRPAKGFAPENTFFAITAKGQNGEGQTRALEGPIDPHSYEGQKGSTVPNHGLPRFRNCSFHAAYPLGQVLLSDPEFPVDVRLEGFNPFVPADPDASGIPAVVLRFVLMNRGARPVSAAVCGTLRNFIGTDGANGQPDQNVNSFRKVTKLAKVQGLLMKSKGVEPMAEQFGTMALATTAAAGVSHRTAWNVAGWVDGAMHDFWDDLAADGKLNERRTKGLDAPLGSLAVRTIIPARGTREITFLLTWHFPNRQTWTPQKGGGRCEGDCRNAGTMNRVGNYYATQYRDAWDVAVRTAASLKLLEADTLKFVRAFCRSDLPAKVKEAALYNLSTLRSQTCFRTEDGRFFGYEGCLDREGCCLGSCTHVWNYEQATAFLFGDFARSMREAEFVHATDDDGLMSFRISLPLERAQEQGSAAADGQMGCIMKLYRDWQLSGDDAFLARLWPKARTALEFCWLPGGWDADQDGVMEGCQHNTTDLEFYGPNPLMGAWYLGALRAAEEMARYVGENEFAGACRSLFERGSQWLDENLFNGDYYEQETRPPSRDVKPPEGLALKWGRSADSKEPEQQIGSGCMTDQLVGQFLAHVCGLGYLLDKKNVRKTLRSVMRNNFREHLFSHFNPIRTFVLNDERALIYCTFPRGNPPKNPCFRHSEVWTGVEYAAAIHMLYEGQTANGLRCIRAIRDRYDGRKRSPFDEAECGHHYARAMASWAGVLALTGFRYSGVEQSMTFGPQDGQCFWSNGYAWGTCRQKSLKRGIRVELDVLHGAITLQTLVLRGRGEERFRRPKTIRAGQSASVLVGR